MRKTIWLVILGVVAIGAACKESGVRTSSTGTVTQVGSDDAEMNAAMQEARDSFDEFLEGMGGSGQDGNTGPGPGLLKAYFSEADDPEGGEHLWIDEVVWDGRQIAGVVVSEPLDLAEPKLGDAVTFPLERLSDWLIVEDGLARGAFTIQVLRSRMSAGERKQHDANYPFRFDP